MPLIERRTYHTYVPATKEIEGGMRRVTFEYFQQRRFEPESLVAISRLGVHELFLPEAKKLGGPFGHAVRRLA